MWSAASSVPVSTHATPPPDGQRDAERSYVQTGTDGAAAHTLELCLYSFFINIINSMFVYYVCHELVVNL